MASARAVGAAAAAAATTTTTTGAAAARSGAAVSADGASRLAPLAVQGLAGPPVRQLRRLVIGYCTHGGSSAGMRCVATAARPAAAAVAVAPLAAAGPTRGASAPARHSDFLDRCIVSFAHDNPGIIVDVRLRPGRHPRIFAEYRASRDAARAGARCGAVRLSGAAHRTARRAPPRASGWAWHRASHCGTVNGRVRGYDMKNRTAAEVEYFVHEMRAMTGTRFERNIPRIRTTEPSLQGTWHPWTHGANAGTVREANDSLQRAMREYEAQSGLDKPPITWPPKERLDDILIERLKREGGLPADQTP